MLAMSGNAGQYRISETAVIMDDQYVDGAKAVSHARN